MAQIQTYDRQPQAQQLGGTTRLSASVDAGGPMKALAGALGATGNAIQQYQGVKDLKTSNRYESGYDAEKSRLTQHAYGVSNDESGKPALNVPLGERADFIKTGLDAYRDGADFSDMSGEASEKVSQWHDEQTVAVFHKAKMHDVAFEMEAAIQSQQVRYNQNLINKYNAERDGDAAMVAEYTAAVDEDMAVLSGLVGESNAQKYKSDGYYNTVKTALSGALDEEEVEEIWSGVDQTNLDAGQHESLFNQKEAKGRAIKSGVTAEQRRLVTAQNELTNDIISRQQQGEFVDVGEVPALLEAGAINERNARRIMFEDWKINSGDPTKANDISHSSISTKVANGTLNSFEQLEESYQTITPDQYRQVEQQLVEKYNKDLWTDPTVHIDRVQKSGATALTLEKEFDRIDKMDITSDGKEALQIITSNAFKLNKNPSLSSAYKEAIAETYELERFLDLPTGTIGMTISGDITSEEDMMAWRDKLKSTWKSEVTKQTQKALSNYSFKQPDVVSVKNADGKEGTIPRSQLKDALKGGYTLNED